MTINLDLIKITIEELRTCGYENVINPCEPNIYDYQSALANAALKAKENENNTVVRAFELLSAACVPMLNSSDPHKPFLPLIVIENHRSLIPADFAKEQGILFAQFAPLVQNPELAARLGDLGWVITRDARAARTAIDAYIEASDSTYCQQHWHERIKRLERAFRLARSLNDRKADDIVNKFLAFLDPNNDPFIFEAAPQICLILLEINTVDHTSLAEKAIDLANKATQYGGQHSYDFQYNLLNIADRTFTKMQYKRANDAKLLAANTLIKKSELAKSSGQALAAAHWLSQGVTKLQQCQGQRDQIITLQPELEALNKAALKEMKRYSVPLDVTKLTHTAIATMQTQDVTIGILKFSFLMKSLERKKLEENAIAMAKQSPLRSSFNRNVYNGDGRLVAIIPPLIGSQGDEYNIALKAACYEEIKWTNIAMAQGVILPARDELVRLHQIDEKILSNILQHCAFFPQGRESLWIKGLLAGFNNEFDIALSLLIPQFEHALRKYLGAKGASVWRIDSNTQLHSEKYLNELLELEMTNELLTEDICFTLQCLLTERIGHNFRNEFAHGLMSELDFYSQSAVYLWWLLLHIVVRFSPLICQQSYDAKPQNQRVIE